MRSEKDSRPSFCLATASKTLKRKIGTQGKSNFISLNILANIKILIPNQIMFATPQYILEGKAVTCSYNLLHYFFKMV
ncbi:hypothetical protein FDUTEX481_08727 [Tolypothrix sp. PCC 7601]|nr:hypothetical protein FDUTEX481_08727 [Tolypothrix sp. PCC 7601]